DRQRAEAFCRAEIGACYQTRPRGRGSRRLGREESAQHLSQVTSPEFMARSICPLAGNGAAPSQCNVTTVRDLGNGRLTLRYQCAPEEGLYAKLHNDIRGHRMQILEALWDDGFNSRSPYRVPKVLAFFPD